MSYGYDQLETLVGLLRQSAIDAWMCQGGQSIVSLHPAKWQIAQDDRYYDINGHITNALDSYEMVERPTADGWGSGFRWVDGKRDGDFAYDFSRRREEIDDLVRPWRDLPDPVKIGRAAEPLKSVYESLIIKMDSSNEGKSDVDRATGGDSVRPPLHAALESTVNYLLSDSGYLWGTTAREFKTLFVGPTRAKINNLCGVALLMYSHVVRQKAMWDGARQDVANILWEGKEKFDAVAQGKSVNWKQVLTTLGLVGDAAGKFTKNPFVQSGLVAADYGLEELGDKHVDHGNVGSHGDVLAGLRKSLKELNDHIKDEEDRIRRSAVEQLSIIWERRKDFRLVGGVRGAEGSETNSRGAAALYFDEIDDPGEFRVGSDPEIKWDFDIAVTITGHMEAVAGFLDVAAIDAEDSEATEGVREYVTRNARIGVGGGYGPSQAVQKLIEAEHDLLANLAGDLRAGAGNLSAASDYFRALENGNVAQLDTLRHAVDAAADDVLDGTGIEVHGYRNIDWWEKMGGK